jgi:hypothetical protein
MSTTVFLLALAALWFGCSNSAREIVAEWPIYRRERMINLKIPSYVASKFTVLGGLSALQCAVLLGIVHYGAGLRAPWLLMFGTLYLTAMVGLALGLTVSAIAKTSEVAIGLLPLIQLPMVILGGVLQPLHKMSRPTAALADSMPMRWAFESLLLMEARGRDKWSPPALPPMAAAAAGPSDAAAQEMDMAEVFFPEKTHRESVEHGAAALGLIFGLLAVAVLGILRFRDIH